MRSGECGSDGLELSSNVGFSAQSL